METIKEAADVGKLITDFIDINWSKDDKSAGKAAQILKGLAFSDDPKAKKFIKDLDTLSNSMKASTYKESTIETIEVMEDVKLPGTHIVLEKGDKIQIIDKDSE